MQRLLLLAACAGSAAALRLAKDAPPLSVADSYGNYWSAARGSSLFHGMSPLVGPRFERNEQIENTSKLWIFDHPVHAYHSIPMGVVVDGEKNVYVTMDTTMFKLSPNNTILWEWWPEWKDNWITTAAALEGDKLYFTTSNGKLWAISARDGAMVWKRKIAHRNNATDRGIMGVQDGLIIAAFNSTEDYEYEQDHGGNGFVGAFSSENGDLKWMMKPLAPTSSFAPCFPGDGTVLFQDREGTAYSHELKTGKQRWVMVGEADTFTRGFPVVANGIVYTVISNASSPRGYKDEVDGHSPGWLTARNVADGSLVWRKHLDMPPDSTPVVGRLPGRSELSIVQPTGYTRQNGTTAIYAFDALTGEEQWTFEGPELKERLAAGVEATNFARFLGFASEIEPKAGPWGSPLIDAAGTVYVGGQDGYLYTLRDENLDGTISGTNELSYIDTGLAPLNINSPAIIPGMFLFPHMGTVVALKAPEVPLA